MMKAPLLIFSVLLSSLVSAQLDENQFLGKYSYPIFIISGDQQFTGTAFLYRSGDTSFLVSNYHAIKGMNPLKKTVNFIADTLFLKYPVNNSTEYKLLPVDISSDVIGETELFSMVDRIDLLKIPIKEPPGAEFYFINDLIDADYLDAIPEEVLVFGFPTKPGSIPEFYSQQQCMEGELNPNGFADYDASLRLSFPEASDTARTIIHNTSRYYYFIKPYAAQGYSGAPVLGKFRTIDNKIFYRFSGVIFAGQPTTRQTWAIKGSVALQYLEGKL